MNNPVPYRPTRRAALALTFAAVAAPAAARQAGVPDIGDPAAYASGRLRARPGAVEAAPPGAGRIDLGLDRRDALMFVPETLDLTAPVPLVLALHGAGQQANAMLGDIDREARRLGFVALAPSSRGRTWELDSGPVGADAAFIDLALQAAFTRVRIDPARIAVLGMSDGASYALSTGMVNGDLFSDVLACAPLRFVAPSARGRPRFFISAGRDDRIAPFSEARDMAEQIEGFGYDVAFHQHRGGHVIDDEGLRQGLERFLS